MSTSKLQVLSDKLPTLDSDGSSISAGPEIFNVVIEVSSQRYSNGIDGRWEVH